MNICASLPNRHREATSFKLVLTFLLLTLCTFTMAPTAWSQESTGSASTVSTEGGDTSSAGMQVAAGASTLLYFPLKAAFAISGGIVGGLAYVFSGGNENAAKSIWTTSLYGTYIITPDHLQGNRPIRFLGVADSNDAPAHAPEPIR
ncbi:MAG: hypothetical protein CAF43_010415 [Nitrospira sp. CG24C]|nr:MAG: hypothetical protein CAF43_010415 [Nitrospira sp. CG24C]TKB55598.1 MAG: hypothetical protein E8D50_01390 [Nitrospira sp.]